MLVGRTAFILLLMFMNEQDVGLSSTVLVLSSDTFRLERMCVSEQAKVFIAIVPPGSGWLTSVTVSVEMSGGAGHRVPILNLSSY